MTILIAVAVAVAVAVLGWLLWRSLRADRHRTDNGIADHNRYLAALRTAERPR